VPGESFLGLLEGLQAAGIRVIATRHEGGASFMAEAHGQLTGRPAVALGTRGVGAANLAIGIHTARQDSSPMFVLVGQVDRPFRGREAFQEIEQATTIGGLAAHAAELTTVEDLPTVVGDAVRAAIAGRPGPAFLAVPEDLIDEMLPAETALDTSRPAPARPGARRSPRRDPVPRLRPASGDPGRWRESCGPGPRPSWFGSPSSCGSPSWRAGVAAT
jgi:acetolactate synthase-1/2/3 large subunit